MPIDNQIEIPQSFMAMYILPGHSRPNAPQEVVLARYEQCEDMAFMLTEHAQTLVFKENCVESEVLVRCLQGLTAAASDFTGKEAEWVICRLAELMGWTPPEITLCLSSVDSSARMDVKPHPESVNKKVKNRHDSNI